MCLFVIIIIIIIITVINFQCLAGFKEYWSLTEQSFSFSTKNFLTVRNVLSITVFCIRICRLEQRLSSFKLSLAFVIIIIIIIIIIASADFDNNLMRQ